jgi:hypothetical protein
VILLKVQGLFKKKNAREKGTHARILFLSGKNLPGFYINPFGFAGSLFPVHRKTLVFLLPIRESARKFAGSG